MFVATVTADLQPARAMIIASRSCCFAFKTSCLIPRLVSNPESSSDFSTLTVPTRTGCPFLFRSTMSETTALNLEISVL